MNLRNDPETIAAQLAELQRDFGPFDLIGLTEVRGSNARRYAGTIQLPGRAYTAWLSDTGGSDRMMVAWTDDRFDLVAEDLGLTSHDGETFPRRNSRRPLLVTLADARGRPATSTIAVREGDFPDDERTSDHRPVMAVFER